MERLQTVCHIFDSTPFIAPGQSASLLLCGAGLLWYFLHMEHSLLILWHQILVTE